MLAPDHPDWGVAGEIEAIERRCDALRRGLVERLNAFVTPVDRADVHELALSLDGVAKALDRCAGGVRRYRIQKVVPGARELAGVLTACVEQAHEGLRSLAGGGSMAELAAEAMRLEKQADRAHQRAVGWLLEEGYEPIVVIKWKEILDLLEDAIGCCRGVADVLERVFVKHG
jgi:hypothetical protein